MAAPLAAVACLLLALAASAAGAGSPAPAPAPAVDCIAAASSVVDCLDYVSPNSTLKRPTKTCCEEVKAAVANPTIVDCLCAAVSSKSMPPLPIDMARVLALPGACGASNDAFSKCSITAGPPVEAPSPSSGGSATGGAAAPPPKNAAASSPITATAIVAAVAAPLLAYCYLL